MGCIAFFTVNVVTVAAGNSRCYGGRLRIRSWTTGAMCTGAAIVSNEIIREKTLSFRNYNLRCVFFFHNTFSRLKRAFCTKSCYLDTVDDNLANDFMRRSNLRKRE